MCGLAAAAAGASGGPTWARRHPAAAQPRRGLYRGVLGDTPSCGAAPRSLPQVKECEQGSRRCSGTACGAPDALPGRRCISRLRGKSATSSLPLQARAPRGSSGHVPGAAAGRCPAPPGTHRRGCRIPSGGTWCAALLSPWRLSQHRGPRALSGAFIGSRQLHALLCGQRRGGECGRGRRETPLGAERAVPYNPPSAAELLRARRRAPPAGRLGWAVRGGLGRVGAAPGRAGARGLPGPLVPSSPPPSCPPSAHRAPAGAAGRRDLGRRRGRAARREPGRAAVPERGVREGAGVRPCPSVSGITVLRCMDNVWEDKINRSKTELISGSKFINHHS
ncbi:uncharacterized protein LOC106630755 isoform X2 [Zonotrichia albicollis]|uniref:uncharacterized protein LOC106630755 isoform X2 n=1 Tax=Zonotrichia albicollis TaxID=44394 RepID=UPI003D80DA25